MRSVKKQEKGMKKSKISGHLCVAFPFSQMGLLWKDFWHGLPTFPRDASCKQVGRFCLPHVGYSIRLFRDIWGSTSHDSGAWQ